MALTLVLAAAAGMALSGLPAMLGAHRFPVCQTASVAVMCGFAIVGLAASAWATAMGASEALAIPWQLPGASLAVGLDPLSAWFLLPVFLLPGLGAWFGVEYWPWNDHPDTAGRLELFYGVLAGGMALLLVARNSILFMLGWEAMALAAFFLVAIDDARPEVRQAAWVYFVATHLGTAALLAMFSLLPGVAGVYDWAGVPPAGLPAWRLATILALALVGFGLKAGLMPLHVWLPAAHSSAPSHVSAVMSGVMIKMGIYGLIRIGMLLQPPPLWVGITLMALGALSALIAAAAALSQIDMKRMLAYSSIENVGLILVGLGLAMVGRTLRQPTWVLLGLGGALLHVLNHSLFKALLFFGAGSVQHATGTRRMDRLGGLAHAMPVAMAAWTIGALAVSAVPGLNGLPGEFTIYLGLFDAVRSGSPMPAVAALACVGVLALTGALALASMVRAVGTMFLGLPRSSDASGAHEGFGPISAVLAIGGAACLVSALIPDVLARPLGAIVRQWDSGAAEAVGELPALRSLGWLAMSMLAAALAGTLWLARRPAGARGAVGTWDCGYAGPVSPRIQYTASSFMALLAGIFDWVATPRLPGRMAPAPFPVSWTFATLPIDRLLVHGIVPWFQRAAARMARVRLLQQGVLHVYLLYILGALTAGMAWAALNSWGWP